MVETEMYSTFLIFSHKMLPFKMKYVFKWNNIYPSFDQNTHRIDTYCPRKEFSFTNFLLPSYLGATTSKNNCIVWLSSYFGTQGSLSVCMLLSSISFFQCSLKATCTHMACSLKFNMDIKVDVPRKKLSFCSFEKWLLQITNLKNLVF